MFKNILFATTLTHHCDDAASYAFDMAMKYNARLHVFHVLGMPSHGYSQLVVNIRTGQKEPYTEAFDAVVRERMLEAYADYLDQYLNVEVGCTVGMPAREIVRKVKREAIDLIVMGAHEEVADTEALRYRNIAGDTLQKVARAAHCPLLIISRPFKKNLWEIRNVLCGTDLTKASMPAFRFAQTFARENKCKLHLFHSVDITTQFFKKAPPQAEIEQQVRQAEEKIRRIYEPEMETPGEYTMAVREGVPYMEILKYARENEVDLISMSHHAGSIFQVKEVLGSTVEEVVIRSACPVVTVNRKNVLDGYEAFKA